VPTLTVDWRFDAKLLPSGRLTVVSAVREMALGTRGLKWLSSTIAITVFCSGAALAGAGKDDAVTMVKSATGFIKEMGADKAYPEINNKAGKFIDRDVYVVV
jgi:hypothetical protein